MRKGFINISWSTLGLCEDLRLLFYDLFYLLRSRNMWFPLSFCYWFTGVFIRSFSQRPSLRYSDSFIFVTLFRTTIHAHPHNLSTSVFRSDSSTVNSTLPLLPILGRPLPRRPSPSPSVDRFPTTLTPLSPPVSPTSHPSFSPPTLDPRPGTHDTTPQTRNIIHNTV